MPQSRFSRCLLSGLFLGLFSQTVGAQTYNLPRPDGSTLEYHLTNRSGGAPQPLMLILQGSDCKPVLANKAVADLQAVSPDAAVLLIEKYGISAQTSPAETTDSGCPEKHLRNDTVRQRVLDAVSVLSHLRREASWWSKDLVVVGGSSGAVVAEQVAPLIPETSHLIVFGFGSRWFKDDLYPGIEQSIAAADMPSAQKDAVLSGIFEELETALQTRRADKSMSGHSHAYWAELLSLDQLALLKANHVPVLALHGNRDTSASPEGAAKLIWLAQAGGVNVTYRSYEDLDHHFKTPDGASAWPRIISDARDWLESH